SGVRVHSRAAAVPGPPRSSLHSAAVPRAGPRRSRRALGRETRRLSENAAFGRSFYRSFFNRLAAATRRARVSSGRGSCTAKSVMRLVRRSDDANSNCLAQVIARVDQMMATRSIGLVRIEAGEAGYWSAIRTASHERLDRNGFACIDVRGPVAL